VSLSWFFQIPDRTAAEQADELLVGRAEQSLVARLRMAVFNQKTAIDVSDKYKPIQRTE